MDYILRDPNIEAEKIARQFAKPEGELGRAIAQWMAKRSVPDYGLAIELLGKLGFETGEVLIEAGCADGSFTEQLYAELRLAVYYGFDHSPEMIHGATDKNSFLVEHRKAHFCRADISDLSGLGYWVPPGAEPQPVAGQVGAVLCMNTIIFLDDPRPFFKAARAVLAPRGRIVLGTPLRPPPGELPESAHALVRWYVAAELRDLLSAEGFEDVTWEVTRHAAPQGLTPRGYLLIAARTPYANWVPPSAA